MEGHDMDNDIVHWWKTDLGDEEIRGVEESIRSRHINQGPVCKKLEDELAQILNVPYVVLTTNGSTALAMSLMACGVGPGDEVIVPAITYIATAHSVLLLGAKVRLVDVQPDRPLIDVNQIEAAITDKTKVILPVHLNGAACDIDAIKTLAKKYELKVIEDTAQAFCSRNSAGYLGTQSDFGIFSMSIAKLITTGEGGFAATRDEASYMKLLKLRNQGVLSVPNNIFDGFGFNLRFNDMLAGVGLAQALKLSEKLAAVKRTYNFYKEQLEELDYLKVLKIRVDEGEVPLWSQALCAERNKVIELLGERGIEARPFNPCLSDSKHLESPDNFPAARMFAEKGLTLPSGPDQGEDNLARTVGALRQIAGEIKTAIK